VRFLTYRVSFWFLGLLLFDLSMFMSCAFHMERLLVVVRLISPKAKWHKDFQERYFSANSTSKFHIKLKFLLILHFMFL